MPATVRAVEDLIGVGEVDGRSPALSVRAYLRAEVLDPCGEEGRAGRGLSVLRKFSLSTFESVGEKVAGEILAGHVGTSLG